MSVSKGFFIIFNLDVFISSKYALPCIYNKKIKDIMILVNYKTEYIFWGLCVIHVHVVGNGKAVQ